jgi:hypothetical protein
MAEVAGHIRRPGPGHELHTAHYSATDSRHNRETGYGPWASVDARSGPVQHDDLEAVSRFPDGPGTWRQT